MKYRVWKGVEMAIRVLKSEEIDEQNKYIEKLSNLVKGKKYHLFTMGCQLNENESEKISGMVEKMGYVATEALEEADLVIFNTCCVRENAEDKILGQLGYFKSLKRSKPDMVIALGGCMAQEPHMVEKFNKTHGQHLDVIFGTHNLYQFPELLYKSITEEKKVIEIWDIDGTIAEDMPIKRDSNIKASVTIMYGCNNFCSYCIVPYVRGRERSREPENIVKEVKQLAKDGYKEITLLGQNVNSYGKDLENPMSFAKLLEKVAKIEGIERIRFVSPHPKDFSDELIDLIAIEPKISRCLHLPLQSGSSSILKRMNRKYTKEQYLSLVDKIRSKIPDVLFTTDIIVGFPGETEEDFLDTMDVVKKVRYYSAFTFVYSKREGTPAARMEDQVDEKVKTERIGRLINVVNEILEEENAKLVGTVQKVLVEGHSKTNENTLTGRTDGGKVVNFEGSDELIGNMIDLEITEQRKWYLTGKIKVQ